MSPSIASSGQPGRQQFSFIANGGYRTVINLAMPDSDNAIADEGNIVASLGMSYVHIPVPFDAPQIFQLRTFFNYMQAIINQKVWVHCALNYRVSAFLYLYYRLVRGLPEEEAIKVMLPGWEPDEVWLIFIDTAVNNLVDHY